MLLLGLAGWTPAAAGNSELDWSKVQAIKPGTPIKVVLHKDQGFRGNRKLRGRFQSATDDSLTLKMEYGPTRTLPRSAVRKVVVHDPYTTKLNWSRVQAVEPGTRTMVVLYNDQAPRGSRRNKGRFRSVTGDSLTLTLKDGQRRTFPKWDVRKVFTRRPILKRKPGWIAFGITALLGSRAAEGSRWWSGLGLALPVSAVFFASYRMGVIYHVPRKYRMQPPADKPSGAQSKASGNASP